MSDCRHTQAGIETFSEYLDSELAREERLATTHAGDAARIGDLTLRSRVGSEGVLSASEDGGGGGAGPWLGRMSEGRTRVEVRAASGAAPWQRPPRQGSEAQLHEP